MLRDISSVADEPWMRPILEAVSRGLIVGSLTYLVGSAFAFDLLDHI
jgi:VIT1/CCC1 family predicted Fe2+/Mn2+ transporter